MVETTAGGWDQGAVNAPRADWKQQRLGPLPPAEMVKLGGVRLSRAHWRRLGCSPSLFNDADGTSKREALRQWHMGVVRPLARMLSAELTDKFGAPVTTRSLTTIRWTWFRGRMVFSKLAAVEGVSPEMALALAQIGDGNDD